MIEDIEQTNEERAATLILDYVMTTPEIEEMLAVRCGEPSSDDDTPYYTKCAEWYSHVMAIAITKLRHYDDKVTSG